MKKRFFIALAIVLSLVMTLGAVSIFTRQVSDPETKKVLINYVIDGEAQPFDSYYAEHVVGDQLRVVSPLVDGYVPRIPVYAARVKSNMNVTVYYDFKAPDVALPDSGILYHADFNTAESWDTYFNSLDGLTLVASGGNSSAMPIEAGIVKNTLHVSDNGRIELRDTSGITQTDSYTITFSMLFKSFEEDGIGTALSVSYSEYNGGSSSVYGKAFRLDSSGKLYLNDGTHVTALETGKWYTFTIYVDTLAQTNELFVNGISFGNSVMYDPDLATNVTFRFFNTLSHTEYYLDNLAIYEGSPVRK